MTQLVSNPLWPQLAQKAKTMPSLAQHFAGAPARFDAFHAQAENLLLDFSRQRLDVATLDALLKLLESQQYKTRLAALFAGEAVNRSENHAALHMALRAGAKANFKVKGENVMPAIVAEREKALAFAEELRSSKQITDIIHVGIGGSDLGPRLLVEACGDGKGPRLHFISNIDGAAMDALLKTLDPARTFVFLASKSFTTSETMLNAAALKAWLGAGWAKQTAALTANPAAAQAFGISDTYIYSLWDWVGGRYSIWSVIGLPAMCAMGRKAFEEFLAGGAAMDAHVQSAPLHKNLAALMAAFSIWNINANNYTARAVLPYAEGLSYFPAYLQQLEMESLGKHTDQTGAEISYATAPVVFGATGTPAQHAFMQALHQGNQIVPADIICVRKAAHAHTDQHAALLANALAQANALAFGRKDSSQPSYRRFEGNRPSSLLVMDELSPRALGQLIALYEHKVFAESVFWDINPFDQWGVELGKTLAGPLAQALAGKQGAGIDPTLQGLIAHLRKS